MNVLEARSALANASKRGDMSAAGEARRALATARIQREIETALASAFPPSAEQRARLAALLTAGE